MIETFHIFAFVNLALFSAIQATRDIRYNAVATSHADRFAPLAVFEHGFARNGQWRLAGTNHGAAFDGVDFDGWHLLLRTAKSDWGRCLQEGVHTMERYTEQSESDAITTYLLERRICQVRTAAGVDTLVADSPTYGRMLFLDGELQSAEADEHIYHETLVHPVMSGVGAGARVLVVGGGEGATVREVMRWRPAAVDWVDYDVDLVNLCRLHLRWAPGIWDNPAVTFYGADIRDVLPTLGLYDVIVLDLPDPDGDTGYLYSTEFWRDMAAHLGPRGRMVTHCGPVRPFRGVGAGFQRVWDGTRDAGITLSPAGFYSIGIPSFQGDWGFWLWSADGHLFDAEGGLPVGLRVVDGEQMRRWGTPSLLWSEAVGSTVLAR